MGGLAARLRKAFGGERDGRLGRPRERAHSRTERFNRRLLPFFGPAQVGPYDQPAEPVEPVDETCAECGQPMSAHRVDRSTGRSRVYCPDPADRS